jgi:glutathione reductase (NADPH)
MGVEVRTGTAVEAVERAGGGLRVRARTGSQEVMVETDLVVHAAGRVPDLDALNLSAVGITVEKGVSSSTKFLQSVSSPAVHAGDAAAKGPPLTPVSSHDGKVVAAIFSKAIATGRTIGASPASPSRFHQLPRWFWAKPKPARQG